MRRIAISLLALILASGLASTPALAQKVSDLLEELTKLAKRIDGEAKDPRGEARVVKMLSEQYDVTEDEIRALRQETLGYGEISILLALSKETGRPPSEILQKRKAGEGWGRIAQDYGVKLGRVISEVKRERGRPEIERPARPGAGSPGPPDRERGRGRGRR